VTFDEVRAVKRTDWFSKKPIAMPVAVAELGLPGLGGERSTHAIRECLTGVLSVDGADVAVEVVGDADRLGVRPLALQLCGDDAEGLRLGAGEHEVRTAVGGESGFDLDRLVLNTAAGPDTPMPLADRNATVRVRESGRTSFDLQVRGEPGKPVWLVLGQSRSDGWHATVAGEDLGESIIADGYANGWLVTPGRDGVVDVKLRWKPQRIVWGGLGASVAGVVLCLGIVVAGRSGRRRELGLVASEPVWVDDPFVTGPPVATSRAGVLAVVVGLVVGVVVHPVLGVVVGAGTLVALRARRGRGIGAGAVGLLAAAGAFTVIKQATEHFVADFGWTDFFHPAHLLAGAALALLGVLLIVDHQRRRGS
jgi:arabinofuranan 3-O-arabinosyltransferase